VKPNRLIPGYLYWDDEGLVAGNKKFFKDTLNGIYILSVGKAAAAIAFEAEKILADKITAGLVVTKYGHALPLQHCHIIEAGHPVPDDNSVTASKAIQQFLLPLHQDGLLLCLISGGASSLIGDIAEGISLGDMQALSKLLLPCGADIHEINTIRKHISTSKGGQLLRYTNNANVVSFIISDVLGDDIGVIASGLTAPDNSTFEDALKVLQKYELIEKIPASIRDHLNDGSAKKITETPKPGDKLFEKVDNNIIAGNSIALHASAAKARDFGYHVEIINSSINGEAKDEAKKFVDIIQAYNGPKPACLLMGGETTVTIKGSGKGGRNQEFVLAALCELLKENASPEKMPVILSGGTDGSDGPTDAAGAFIDINVILNMQKLSINPLHFLQTNNAYNFFKQVDGLLITGPTQTNVMDIIIGLIHT